MPVRLFLSGLAITVALHIGLEAAEASEKSSALFTLYYVAEVKSIAKGAMTGKVQAVDGKWFKYRVSHKDHRDAHMQGTAFSKQAV